LNAIQKTLRRSASAIFPQFLKEEVAGEQLVCPLIQSMDGLDISTPIVRG
jgi:hypothetical protein